MKPNLTKVTEGIYYFDNEGKYKEGTPPFITGDVSGITGDVDDW